MNKTNTPNQEPNGDDTKEIPVRKNPDKTDPVKAPNQEDKISYQL